MSFCRRQLREGAGFSAREVGAGGSGGGQTPAPFNTPGLAVLSPRCMHVAVGMQKRPVTYFVGSGANVLELRRPPWQEVGWKRL